MTNKALLATVLLVALPGLAIAEQHDWSGTGEFGFAMARGNARSDNANGKIAFAAEDTQWKHSFYLSALRSKSEVSIDTDGDGTQEKVMQKLLLN